MMAIGMRGNFKLASSAPEILVSNEEALPRPQEVAANDTGLSSLSYSYHHFAMVIKSMYFFQLNSVSRPELKLKCAAGDFVTWRSDEMKVSIDRRRAADCAVGSHWLSPFLSTHSARRPCATCRRF